MFQDITEDDYRNWGDLPLETQLRLLQLYGHYLDRLPPTCSMDTKIERFRQWLREQGIHFDGMD